MFTKLKTQSSSETNRQMTRHIHCYYIFVLSIVICADGAYSQQEQPIRVLNKCCPLGEEFERGKGILDNYECAPVGNTTGPQDDFSWFPIEFLVNSTTKQTSKYKYRQVLRKHYLVNYGNFPECADEHRKRELIACDDAGCSKHFRYLVEDDLSIIPQLRFRTNAGNRGNTSVETDTDDMYKKFALHDACTDTVKGTNSGYVIFHCFCQSVLCISKCCREGYIINASTEECQLSNGKRDWRPENMTSDKYYLLTDTFPECPKPFLLKLGTVSGVIKPCARDEGPKGNDFTILKDGSVKVNKYRNPEESHRYCGEATWHSDDIFFEQNLILCGPADDEPLKPMKFLLYGILFIIGGICLLVTVAVSLYLPELRRRIHNKIALSHNICLMVAYFAWGYSQLSTNLKSNQCIFVSLLIQFTFLGSFFWLNVMCIDISMTFSKTKTIGAHTAAGETKTFIYYSIYSWGCAAVITMITTVMEYLPDVPFDLQPGLTCNCGFNKGNYSIIIYFYGPMCVILIINLVLFIYTTFRIMDIQRQTAILHKTDSNTTGGTSYRSDKQRYDPVQWLILYAKLFLLMGLTWVTEIVSWAVGGPAYYWYFSDVINLLRGVFIFIIFICKKPILLSLKHRLRGESYSMSNKTASSKSTTDVLSFTTSNRDSRFRASTSSSSNRRDTVKSDNDGHVTKVTKF